MLLICETARIISDQLRCGSQGQLLKIRRLDSESFSARLAVVVDLSGTPSMCCWYSCGDSKSYDNARYRHSWYFEGIDIQRDDHLKSEPMDLNISAYRFVNVTTYAYNYQIMIKEHSVIKNSLAHAKAGPNFTTFSTINVRLASSPCVSQASMIFTSAVDPTNPMAGIHFVVVGTLSTLQFVTKAASQYLRKRMLDSTLAKRTPPCVPRRWR